MSHNAPFATHLFCLPLFCPLFVSPPRRRSPWSVFCILRFREKERTWVPAFAGMTPPPCVTPALFLCHPHVGGGPGLHFVFCVSEKGDGTWIPSSDGMTAGASPLFSPSPPRRRGSRSAFRIPNLNSTILLLFFCVIIYMLCCH